jgi:predicted DNA-binding protein
MSKPKKKAVKVNDHAHEILKYINFKTNKNMSDIVSEAIIEKYGVEYENYLKTSK